MKKTWVVLIFALVFSLAGTTAFAGEPVVYDINGGFEKTETFTKYEEQYRNWIQQGMELPDPFIKPKDWHLSNHPEKAKLEVITDGKEVHSGQSCLKLISGSIYYYFQPWSNASISGTVLKANDRLTLKVWVKGQDDTPFMARFYLYGVKKDGSRASIYDDGKGGSGMIISGKATPEWKQYTAPYTVPDAESVTLPGCRVTYVSPALQGKGVFFDDVEVLLERAPAK